jgi:predicted metalloprotease with PDZ domain
VSEGLTVYYEYLIVKRAGLISEEKLFEILGSNINAHENDPGRYHQSLSQASFNTWSDGPFGNKKEGDDRSISYYEKGPLTGLILDFAIRNATQNKKSLDDVMRLVYREYYKKLQRGFTDAEFQQACEEVAGISLSREFEYVYTTREIDYKYYLAFAGLNITEHKDENTGKIKFVISRLENMNAGQEALLKSWSGK